MATKVASLYAEIGADLSQLNSGLAQAKTGMADAAGSMEASGGKVESALNAIVSAGIAFAATGIVKEIVETSVELAELGAESIRAEQAFVAMSGEVDNTEAAIRRLRDATGGEVSQAELLTHATRLLTDGLAGTTSEVETLFKAAEGLGDVMGMSTTQAIEKLTSVLETRSPRALRALGINADAVKKRVDDLSESTTGLSDEQIYLMGVLGEINVVLDKTRGKIDDNVDAFDRMTASTADLKASLGENLLPGIADVADFLTQWSRGLVDNRHNLEALNEQTMLNSESYLEYVRILGAAGYRDIATEAIWEQTRAEHALAVATEISQQAIAAFIATGGSAPGMLLDIASAAGDAATKVVDYIEAMALMEGGSLKLNETLSKQYSAWEAIGGAMEKSAARGKEALGGREMAEPIAPAAVAQLDQFALAQERYNTAAGPAPGLMEAIRAKNVVVGSAAAIAALQVDALNTSIGKVPTKIEPMVEIQNLDPTMTAFEVMGRLTDEIEGTHNVWFNIRTTGSFPTPPGGLGGQQGGIMSSGGLITVGEAGPELVALPQGARVYPHEESRAMAGGATWTGDLVISGAGDPQATAAAVLQALQSRGIVGRSALR